MATSPAMLNSANHGGDATDLSALTQVDGNSADGSASEVNAKIAMSDQKERGTGQSHHRGQGDHHRNSFRSSHHSGSAQATRPADFPLRILVLSDMVGAIIGRSGGTIKQITQQTHARVDVHRKENAGALEKVITIYGNPDNCSQACKRILEVMQTEANQTNRGEIPLKILAHNNLIGRIIGKSGATIKRIMEQTDTKITVSSSVHDVNTFNLERIITIKGTLDNICRAEEMISQRLRHSYESDLAAIAPQAMLYPGLHPMAIMSTMGTPYSMPGPSHMGRGGGAAAAGPSTAGPYGLSYPPSYSVPQLMYASSGGTASGLPPPALTAFQSAQGDLTSKETVNLYIPNTAVGAIIGTGGTTIKDMISSSGAVIKVAQPTKDETVRESPAAGDRPPTERKVTIVGNPEAQWKAQFMIYCKVRNEALSPMAMPPDQTQLRVEIMIPSAQVGRLIGKGGSVVKEMQRNTRAIIKLPEESRGEPEEQRREETPVHIIGDFLSTQAAQRQIRALVSRTTVPSVGKSSQRERQKESSRQTGSHQSSSPPPTPTTTQANGQQPQTPDYPIKRELELPSTPPEEQEQEQLHSDEHEAQQQ